MFTYTHIYTCLTSPAFHCLNSSEADYRRFPGNPRQQQAVMSGQGFFPFPLGQVAIPQHELEGAREMANSVFIRGFHVNGDELRETIDAKYKAPKRKHFA